MEVVVLSIHLLVCICLIGLVLLQRSEGGALGMGGGGGGALMSGRGAADALAKMTQVAGGFFLVTSLSLTVLSGAGAGNAPTIDFTPQRTAPATTTPAAPAPSAPAETAPAESRPDPTESSVTPSTQLASIVSPSSAAAATPSETRAAPLNTASRPAAPAPQPVQTSANTTQRAAPPRSTPATTTANQPARQLVLPNSSGAASGVTFEDAENESESIQVGNGLEAVRRETRAGPDQ